jgi:hypothetical protein
MAHEVQSELESRIYELIVRTAGPYKVGTTEWSTIAAACPGSSEADIMQAIRTLVANGVIHKTWGGWLPGKRLTY